MSRLKPKPLRGSVMQNTLAARGRGRDERHWFGFGLRLGAVGMALVVVLGGGAWLWHSGWPQRRVEALGQGFLHMTQKARFAVRDVTVTGRRYTDKAALFAALDTGSDEPILAFDPDAAQGRVKALPWVATAVIERHWPDRIAVHLTEREPLARWQYQGRIGVIDTKGEELPEARPGDFAALPLVVGPDAPHETPQLLAALKDFPELAPLMKAAVRVGERRWDLHLQRKAAVDLVVKLPEANMPGALARLARLMKDQGILERDLVALDLRVPDRLVLEPRVTETVTKAKSVVKERP